MLIQCLIENSSLPCFVFGLVFFLSYLENGTGFCTSIAFCFNVCMYLVIRVDRERSGSEVARELDPRQRDLVSLLQLHFALMCACICLSGFCYSF